MKCGNTATHQFSLDIDLPSIGTCKDCESDVKMALYCLGDGTDMAHQLTNGWHSQVPKN